MNFNKIFTLFLPLCGKFRTQNRTHLRTQPCFLILYLHLIMGAVWLYSMKLTIFGAPLVFLALVVELVDTQDLKSCKHCVCAGSSPARGTKSERERESDARQNAGPDESFGRESLGLAYLSLISCI